MEGEAARAAVRIALDHADDGVRQAALHAVAMRRDREAQARVVHLLNSADPFHRRKAAEALGRMGEIAGVPALLAAAAKLDEGLPEDAAALRIQEHAVIHALIEIGDATATRVGLTAKHPGTRRAALIALDQMDHGGLRVGDAVPLLTEPDPGLKSAALWTAENHPEWGAELAGYSASNSPGQTFRRRSAATCSASFDGVRTRCGDPAVGRYELENDSLEKGRACSSCDPWRSPGY